MGTLVHENPTGSTSGTKQGNFIQEPFSSIPIVSYIRYATFFAENYTSFTWCSFFKYIISYFNIWLCTRSSSDSLFQTRIAPLCFVVWRFIQTHTTLEKVVICWIVELCMISKIVNNSKDLQHFSVHYSEYEHKTKYISS